MCVSQTHYPTNRNEQCVRTVVPFGVFPDFLDAKVGPRPHRVEISKDKFEVFLARKDESGKSAPFNENAAKAAAGTPLFNTVYSFTIL